MSFEYQHLLISQYFSELDCFDYGLDWVGTTLSSKSGVFSPRDCQNLCKSHAACSYFVYSHPDRTCYLRIGKTGVGSNGGVISGPPTCPMYQGNESFPTVLKIPSVYPSGGAPL
jgi:PAN domain